MITEKELRTGNLYATLRHQEVFVTGIDTLNKFVTFSSFGSTDISSTKENSIIFEDLTPIEITPKSIAQFGLVADELMSIEISSNNEIRFIWSEKLSQVVLADGDKGIIGQEIKYIHQFQNIYYFLTGKELIRY